MNRAWMPGLAELPAYRRAWLPSDLIAGFSVAAIQREGFSRAAGARLSDHHMR